MTTNPPKRQASKPKRSVIQWLLDSDPSIGWQVMRDLTDASGEDVVAERATGGSPAVVAARKRGQEYILERRMLRSLSTGEVIDPAWTKFSFPTGYHYDVLRGLEYLRSAGITPDARMAEAIGLVVSKRDVDGRWLLENGHPDQLDSEPGAAEGSPSRWNTLRALRVLDWYSA
jgi:hypothetical protein